MACPLLLLANAGHRSIVLTLGLFWRCSSKSAGIIARIGRSYIVQLAQRTGEAGHTHKAATNTRSSAFDHIFSDVDICWAWLISSCWAR
jgi:hypothetical protein